jgi:hypothetical protein
MVGEPPPCGQGRTSPVWVLGGSANAGDVAVVSAGRGMVPPRTGKSPSHGVETAGRDHRRRH